MNVGESAAHNRRMDEDATQNLPHNDLKRILAHLESINARLSSLENRLDSLETRFTSLEDKVDRRLQETRPIWEQALAKLNNLESDMRTGFRRIERQVGLLAEDVMIVRADQRDLEKRMSHIEQEPAT